MTNPPLPPPCANYARKQPECPNVLWTGLGGIGQLGIRSAYAEQGIHVSQLVIGGAIEEGHKEKDPKVLAETLWSLHDKRDKFRVEVATG